MNNNAYKLKYLKYKEKYLKFKEIIGGADREPLTEEQIIELLLEDERRDSLKEETVFNKTDAELIEQINLKFTIFEEDIFKQLDKSETKNIEIFEELLSQFKIDVGDKIFNLLKYCQTLLDIPIENYYVIRLDNYNNIQFQMLKIVRNELKAMGMNAWFIRWDKTKIMTLNEELVQKKEREFLDASHDYPFESSFKNRDISSIKKNINRKDLWLCFAKKNHAYNYAKNPIETVFKDDGRDYIYGKGRLEINYLNPDGSLNTDITNKYHFKRKTDTFNLLSIVNNKILDILDEVPQTINQELLELLNVSDVHFTKRFLDFYPLLKLYFLDGSVINLRFEWINNINESFIKRILINKYPKIFKDQQMFYLRIKDDVDIVDIVPYINDNKDNKYNVPELYIMFNAEAESPLDKLRQILNVRIEDAWKKISEADYESIDKLYKTLLSQ